MTKYRLKSKLYGEFDGEGKKKNGIFGTGISAGQALMIGTTALAGRGIYRNMAFKGKIGGVGSQAHVAEVTRRAGKLSPGAHNKSALEVRTQQRNILNNARNGGQDSFTKNLTMATKQGELSTLKQDLSHVSDRANIIRNSGLSGSKGAALGVEKSGLQQVLGN